MPRHLFAIAARWTAVLALAFLPGCGKKEAAPPAETPPSKPTPAEVAETAKKLSEEIEAFTGARTRIVWAQHQDGKSTDPRSNKRRQFLMGLDTGDGLGARAILDNEDNYSRPLLSSDGETILFTRKSVSLDAQDVKSYAAVIMRTGWKGAAPVEISDGYAVGAWRDPATGIEWAYAVRDLAPSALASIEARKLIRFQLADPAQQELVWDRTPVSPDNIQLSRDGRRASGQFPAPTAGQFIFEKKSDFKKLPAGSWPSMAPDNSYASWILDDGNKSLTLVAEDAEPWTVTLTTMPGLAKGAVLHPCWTNHPRFITLTGPYLPDDDVAEDSAIGSGGLSSEVFIGKFSGKLEKIDGWLRITDNALNDIYPAVWIEGGDTAVLQGFAQTHETKPTAPEWSPVKEGLVFLWQDREADNTVNLPNGTELDCNLDMGGAARYGRGFEMLLDAGAFAPKPEVAGVIADALHAGMPLTIGFVLHIEGDVKAAHGTLATFPHLRLTIRDGIINGETSSGIIGIGPVLGKVSQFTAATGAAGYSFTLQELDGKSTTRISRAKPRLTQGKAPAMLFGGVNGKGIGMSHVAIYARELSAAEIRDQVKSLASLAPASPTKTLKLRAKLIQTTPMPTADGISPDTRALIGCVYEVVQVTEGDYTAKQILVNHWGMIDGKPARGFPRRPGLEFDLLLQPLADHPELKDERTMPLEAGDLEPWYDISAPILGR